MNIYSRIHHPPDQKPAFDSSITRAHDQAEAVNAIHGMWLALEEARSIDEHRIGRESDKLANLCSLLAHSPHDHVRIVMVWRSFRLPIMIDGLGGAHERAVEAMEVFMRR